jgi:hypothetical protein
MCAQFTCFTSTEVQILTPTLLVSALLVLRMCAQFTCFTSTEVQILTPTILISALLFLACAHVPCVTSTKERMHLLY